MALLPAGYPATDSGIQEVTGIHNLFFCLPPTSQALASSVAVLEGPLIAEELQVIWVEAIITL